MSGGRHHEADNAIDRWLASRGASPESDGGARADVGTDASAAGQESFGSTASATAPAPEPAPAPEEPNARVPQSPGRPEPTLPPHEGDLTRRSIVPLVTLLALLLALAAAGVTGWYAWQERTEPALGVFLTCAALIAVIWAVRASTSRSRVRLEQGVLLVGGRDTRRYDLTSPALAVEVRGTPRRAGWRVTLTRHPQLPQGVITAGMVDPHRFMRVVRHYRPELDT